MKTIQIQTNLSSPEQLISILRRRIRRRCHAEFVTAGAELTLHLQLDESIGSQGYRIEGSEASITILGDGMPGLTAGIGKFLRTSRYTEDGLIPSPWRGTSTPTSPLRGIQIDIHFCNFYHMASAQKLQEYTEDLALWGINHLDIQFPLIDFCGWDDPEVYHIIRQMKAIEDTARPLGIKVGMEVVPNQDFVTFRPEFKALPNLDPTGRRGNNGNNICPNKPGAMEYILTETYGRVFTFLKDQGIRLDFICFWPYDEGGCSCEKCYPWGANGYLKVSKAVCEKAKEVMPDIDVILSTWVFDAANEGEWEGLSRVLGGENGWVDYILADSHTDFPEYPLKNGVPGGLPLLNYPEISMWALTPWGGYGANPLPDRFHRLWQQVKDHVSGGIAYSEGIFDDINKVVVSQFYWNKDTTCNETLQEYIAYDLGDGLYEDVRQIIRLIEQNHVQTSVLLGKQVKEDTCQRADEAIALVNKVNSLLPEWSKNCWRWRILAIRAELDRIRYHRALEQQDSITHNTSWTEILKGSKEAKAAMEELVQIFHSNLDADDELHPMFQHLRPAIKEI